MRSADGARDDVTVLGIAGPGDSLASPAKTFETFRLLQDSVGGITPNTLNTRIKELREAGLMTHGSDGYGVTPSGADLLKRLNDLQAFASKWVASRPAAAKSPVSAS